MPDNLPTQSAAPATPAAGTIIATRIVTYSGDATAQIAPTGLVIFAGADDAKTATDVDSSNPLPVTIISSALPSGAATSANQSTEIAGLAAILTALGSPFQAGGSIGNTTFAVTQGTATNLKAQAEVYQGGVAVSAAAPLQVSLANTAANATPINVTVATALPAGTNAIGKLAANSGVDIGDVDVTSVVPGTGATNLGKAEDGGHTSGDVGVMTLGVRVDTPNTALSGTDLDYTPIATTSTGAVRPAPPSEDFAALANGPQVKKYYTNAGAVTDGIVWSPAAGKRWYVTDIFVGVSAACTVTLEDDKAGGDEAVFKMEFAANSGWSHGFETPWFSGEDAADLLVTTTAGNVYITICGYEI